VTGSTAAPPPIARRSREKSTSRIFGCHQQPAEQRVHSGEDRRTRALQDIDEAVHVARFVTSQFSAPNE